MSYRFDSTPLIAGAYMWGNRGHGVLAEDIPSTGESGPSYLFNDLTFPADNGKEIRGEIIALPSAGTFTADEYGRFEHTGASDGDYTTQYRLYVDGADQGTAFIYTSFGGDTATVTATQAAQTSVVSATSTAPSGSSTIIATQAAQTSVVAATSEAPPLSYSASVTATQAPQTASIAGDTDFPCIITLNGPNPTFVNIDTSYTELGAIAIDDVDGNLTGSIIVGGDTVDAATLGVYTVTYTVTDSASHVSQASRTVVVRDPAALAAFAVVESPVVGCVISIN